MKQPHINCGPEDISPYVILPGDPARVERIASFLEGARDVAFNREFRTMAGTYRGVPVTVTSTGIGGPSMAIALEELVKCGGKFFIRTGSCGACRPEIGMGDLVLSSASVREDGASKMYLPPEYPAAADPEMLHTAMELCRSEGYKCFTGITRSHDSFYIDDEADRMRFWHDRGVLASDMETSALYTIASLRGVRALSILNNVVLYEGDLKEGIADYVSMESKAGEGEKSEIILALKTLENTACQES